MALSEQTIDHLLDVESHLRTAIKGAAVNEKPLVVSQLSKILMDVEYLREFEKLQDIVDNHINSKE
jgi:hypothetical protein|tara:strand:- start:186 stop:383 length:198 start_codon:yes stop_codon:yes gene_type:complete